jgi:hypothetical protein
MKETFEYLVTQQILQLGLNRYRSKVRFLMVNSLAAIIIHKELILIPFPRYKIRMGNG